MTKNEFITQLATELHKNNIADADDVIAEYEQHFAFKQADGYSEEEIAAKLGNPTALAAQFGETVAPKHKKGSKPLVIVGLCIVDMFAGLFFCVAGGMGDCDGCRFHIICRAYSLPFMRTEHPQSDSHDAVLVRRNFGVFLRGARRVNGCRLRLLCSVPAPACPLLRAISA